MTIVFEHILTPTQLPTLASPPSTSVSKLSIRLRTPSLNCLNIPLDTYAGFRHSSSSLGHDQRKIIAGSVDLISEIPWQSNDAETLTRRSVSKPLTSFASPKRSDWRHVLKERFHVSSSVITPATVTDSIARLRRARQLAHLRQSSLQGIDNVLERKHRYSFNCEYMPNVAVRFCSFSHQVHGPLPKLTRRQLSFRTSTSSPFMSLPEIGTPGERRCEARPKKAEEPKTIPSDPTASWEKSSSWSWKSTATSPAQSAAVEQRQTEDDAPNNLPVIIESPLPSRLSSQALPPLRPARTSQSNLSFISGRLRHLPQRLYQKRHLLPHSISNYDVSPSVFTCHPTSRYPSTPVLNHAQKLNLDPLGTSPLAMFDDTDDSISTATDNSSFCSCIDSLTEFSKDSLTQSTSSSSLNTSFPDLASLYDLPRETLYETHKSKRSALRHLCTIQ